jgi:hypothetical protein
MPERIQLHRTKGWRKPEGAIVVARPSRWGNPYRVSDAPPGHPDPQVWAVEQFRLWATTGLDVDDIRASLRGHDLACWCPADRPCHGDVLVEIANEP